MYVICNVVVFLIITPSHSQPTKRNKTIEQDLLKRKSFITRRPINTHLLYMYSINVSVKRLFNLFLRLSRSYPQSCFKTVLYAIYTTSIVNYLNVTLSKVVKFLVEFYIYKVCCKIEYFISLRNI